MWSTRIQVAKNERSWTNYHHFHCTLQPIFRGMFEAFAPQLLDDKPGSFTLSIQWINEFMKIYMNWTIRKWHIATNKLSLDWIEQRFNMNYKVAYLAKFYGIRSSLVVNSKQTSIHLVHATGDKTWHIKVQNMSKF